MGCTSSHHAPTHEVLEEAVQAEDPAAIAVPASNAAENAAPAAALANPLHSSTRDDANAALLHACAGGDAEAARKLLEGGVDKDADDQAGRTSLILASEAGNAEIVALLLAAGAPGDRGGGADTEATDQDGCTALIHASMEGNAEVARLLLAAGADPEARDRDGCTALICGSVEGDAATVALLLAAGADKEVEDEDGHTALIGASINRHAEIVRMLLEAGADKQHANKDGRTAADWASEKGQAEVVLALGADEDEDAGDEGLPGLGAAGAPGGAMGGGAADQQEEDPGELDARALAKVGELRAFLGDFLAGGLALRYADDFVLCRFLVSRDFHVRKTAEMFRAAIGWRTEHDIESIMASEETEEHLCGEQLFFSFVGNDRHLIQVVRLGSIPIARLVRDRKQAEFLHHFVRAPERNLRALQAMPAPKRLVHSVLDLSGIGKQHLRHMGAIKKFVGVLPNIIPDVTQTVSIINAPWIFSKIWKIISPIVPAATRRKVNILGGPASFEARLVGFADKDLYPAFCFQGQRQGGAEAR